MRVVHFTDIHFQAPPRFTELMHIKRIMGTTNLYLLGRHSKFDPVVQRAVIDHTLELEPDLVIITGDLTAQALRSEFELARESMLPVLERFPTVLQAGNHDSYITLDPPDDMCELFGEWMTEKGAGVKHFGPVSVLCVESCRRSLLSQGYVRPESLARASELLAQLPESQEFVFMCMHYPLLNRKGDTYGPKTRAIRNADEVLEWLKGEDRINAYLHGHEHHGYTTPLSTGGGDIPSINPGTSGYRTDSERNRRAAMAQYHIEDGTLTRIDRYRWMDDHFEQESEAFASGR